ncbi:Gfo/Idh/MocA family protein [Filimonas effusa]|uniref:Gfo/Idh/MocA family oxidoreductase n=1 Tax=Filimonas effusa TaxID=2508721 RepID=A0A4Q1DBF2_9BACT|nr:Gfo/Idh/MocA family oxidoreductase [Filimonas effusa]RXK86781.1 Gfo/Idh/MocA family oxidoreductase [Filimonas effusa]
MTYLSRRSFLQKFSIGVGVLTLPAIGRPGILSSGYAGKKLRVALIGLGNYANLMAEGLRESKYCELAGIVTGTPEKAKKWQAKYHIPDKNIYSYERFDEIAKNKDIELVYITMPNGLHKEYAIRAARAGKHVITEKPMATNAKDCEEMIAACEKAGVYLAVGYRLHFEPTHIELKRLGQESVFGQVRMIEASLGYRTFDLNDTVDATFDINNRKEWHVRKAISGGGALINLGIYPIQACRYILGEEPVAVTAQFGPVHNKKRFSQVEETILWQMEFGSGACTTSTTSYGFNIDRLYAVADSGSFELSPALSYGPFKGKTSKGELNFPVINQQATQIDAIGKQILAGAPLPAHITGEEGLKDMRVVDAIYKAAETGKKVFL